MEEKSKAVEFKVKGLTPVGTEQSGQRIKNQTSSPSPSPVIKFPDPTGGKAGPARQNYPSYVFDFFNPKK